MTKEGVFVILALVAIALFIPGAAVPCAFIIAMVVLVEVAQRIHWGCGGIALLAFVLFWALVIVRALAIM